VRTIHGQNIRKESCNILQITTLFPELFSEIQKLTLGISSGWEMRRKNEKIGHQSDHYPKPGANVIND